MILWTLLKNRKVGIRTLFWVTFSKYVRRKQKGSGILDVTSCYCIINPGASDNRSTSPHTKSPTPNPPTHHVTSWQQPCRYGRRAGAGSGSTGTATAAATARQQLLPLPLSPSVAATLAVPLSLRRRNLQAQSYKGISPAQPAVLDRQYPNRAHHAG